MEAIPYHTVRGRYTCTVQHSLQIRVKLRVWELDLKNKQGFCIGTTVRLCTVRDRSWTPSKKYTGKCTTRKFPKKLQPGPDWGGGGEDFPSGHR